MTTFVCDLIPLFIQSAKYLSLTLYTIFLMGLIALLIQFLYWYLIFRQVVSYPVGSIKQPINSPSHVIICIKNEYDNLQKNLKSVLDQDNQHYKVIVVDDHSVDRSVEFIESLQQDERHLICHKIRENQSGKKQALASGIVKVDSPWIIVTDADCTPLSVKWVDYMIHTAISTSRQIVLGYSPYKHGNRLVEKWSHFESWITAVQYLSLALIGRPYMGVGRNTLYASHLLSPELLFRHGDLASGDDDLTIMQLATGQNTAICIHPDSFVLTYSQNNWRDYFRQKVRHFSTGHRYKTSTILWLSMFSFCQMFFFLFCFVLLIKGYFLHGIGLILVRLAFILPVAKALKSKLDAEFSLLHFIIYDMGLALFYLVFSFAVLFPRKKSW